MATLLRPDGESREVMPQDGAAFTLEELREHIGGPLLQIVEAAKPGLALVCNDGARTLGLPTNKAATAQYWLGRIESICGPALVVPWGEIGK